MSTFYFLSKRAINNSPLQHFTRTHYSSPPFAGSVPPLRAGFPVSIIPVFQHSNRTTWRPSSGCELSELTCYLVSKELVTFKSVRVATIKQMPHVHFTAFIQISKTRFLRRHGYILSRFKAYGPVISKHSGSGAKGVTLDK